MLPQFQARYPTGSLVSELLTIYQGKFVVRVSFQVEGVTRATGMAAAETPELAEDRARSRALAVIGIDKTRAEEAESEVHTDNISNLAPLSYAKPKKEPLYSLPPLAHQVSAPSAPPSPPLPLIPRGGPEFSSGDHASSADGGEKLRRMADVSPPLPLIPRGGPEFPFGDLESPPLTLIPSQIPEPPPVFVDTQNGSSEEAANSLGDVTPDLPLNYTSEESAGSLAQTNAEIEMRKSVPVDLSDAIARTSIELKRLNWSNQQGREYLRKQYGKRSRQELTDEEMLEFLHYLESQPTSSVEPFA